MAGVQIVVRAERRRKWTVEERMVLLAEVAAKRRRTMTRLPFGVAVAPTDAISEDTRDSWPMIEIDLPVERKTACPSGEDRSS